MRGQDMTSLITTLGVFMTLIAVIFGIASIYVARKHRREDAEEPAQHPIAAHAHAPTPAARRAPPREAAPEPSGRPLFRKLGPHGLEETGAGERENDGQYVWE
jgi:hypothetical protein